MGSGSVPEIKLFDLVTDLVEYLLGKNAPKATLVIASTRESFIKELHGTINPQARHQEQHQEYQQGSPNQTSTSPGAITTSPALGPYWLSQKRIGLISTSRKVTVSFCPSLEHLRAYLGLFREEPGHREPEDTRPHASPILAIVNLVAIHSQTLEFSAQGLSRTFALAVEAASKERTDLVLCECNSLNEEPVTMYGTDLWKCRVPILNTYTATDRRGEDGPASPTIRIEQVAEKWFTFDRPVK